MNHFIHGKEGRQVELSRPCFQWGDLDLGDDLLDPYLLNPKDSYTQEQKEQSSDRVGIAKKNEINAW